MNRGYLERESDAPVDWQSNAVFVRDGRGHVICVSLEDDAEEASANVDDD